MIPGFPQVFYPVGGGTFPTQTQLSDDAGKIFVGGLPADAVKESLTEYFSQFGDISDCIIMVDNVTGRSRGFGFVSFLDQSAVNKVLSSGKHSINGKVVDAKRAVPKGPNQGAILRSMGITSNRADRNPECKVFVGGVAQGTIESDLEQYFKEYGKVQEVKIPKDQHTQRARGFSFVLFETPEAVRSATKERYHRINGKMVEVKTVQVQPGKANQFDARSDDGQIRSPPSPFMLSQRPSYYQTYPPTYLGMNANAMNPGYYNETPYEHSHSGSTGSAASLGSSGYGNLPGSSSQRLDEYNYMTQLYTGMNELSIRQQYPRTRIPTMHRAQFPIQSGEQLSAAYTPPGGPSPSSIAAYHGDVSSYGTSSPVYASMGGMQQVPSQYAPSSTPQPVASIQTFNR